MPIFKYFTDEAHALSFIKKGNLLMRPLSYFRAQEEDEGIRGDRRDGILTYAPEGGLQMNMEDGSVRILEAGSFSSSVHQNDIFVFCASNQLSDELAGKFGRFCVEIDPECIVRRLKLRAHPSSQFDYEQAVSGNVDYRPHDRKPGVDWALPEKLLLVKPEGFAWQDEFRIAIGKRNTLAVENVALTLQIGSAAAGAVPVQTHLILNIKKLMDVARLHIF